MDLMQLKNRVLDSDIVNKYKGFYRKNRKAIYSIILLTIFVIFATTLYLINNKSNNSKASVETTHTIGSGGNTALTSGTSSSTIITASNVTLDKNANWFNISWNYKKNLTIKNLSSSSISAGTPIQITLSTASLESIKTSCDDLRIIYTNNTDLNRSITLSNGGTNCTDSNSTIITFALQASLAAGASDSTNYALYYGNTSATAPSNTQSAPYSFGSKSPKIICPFNSTTTCLDSKTPTQVAGPVRYSGLKTGMHFDGIDDYLLVADSTSFQTLGDASNSMSFEMWLKRDVITGANMNFIEKSQNGNLAGWGARLTTSGFLHARLSYSGTFIDVIAATNALTTTNWYHVALVVDRTNNTARWYINGTADSNVVSIAGLGSLANTQTLNVGAGAQAFGTTKFWGSIDEVGVYNRVLSSSEIASHYNSGNGAVLASDTNTKLLLHLDENGADPRNTTKAFDASGNSNHATLTGGVTYASGLVGVDSSTSDSGKISTQNYAGHQGIFFEEATTNLMINPSFETGVTGWSGVSTTRTQDSTTAKFGTSSMKIIGDNVDTSARAFLTFTASTQTTYSLSAWVKTDSGTATGVKLSLLETSGTSTNGSLLNIGTDWQKVTLTATTSSSFLNAYFAIYIQNSGALSKTIYIDGVQVEQKSFPTTYTDGSLGTGYAWTGTAHASTSTRTISYTNYASSNMDTSKGTISFWFKPNWNGNDGLSHGLTQNFVDVNNYIQLSKDTNNVLRFAYKVGNVNKVSITPSITTWTTNNWYHIVAIWDINTAVTGTSFASLFINNVRTNDASSSSAFTGITSSSFSIGNNTNGSDGVFSDYRVYDTPLNATEVADLYNSSLVSYSQTTSNQAKYSSTGTWTSPQIDLIKNGLWGASPNFIVSETLNGNSTIYKTRTSPDGVTWSNYASVSPTSGNYDISSPPAKYLQIEATLNSANQTSTPTLSGLQIHYVQDSTAPPTNATNVLMKQTPAGPSISQNDWANVSGPYFSWDAGSDEVNGSGLKGYCLYLGQSSSPDGDPATSKGLLGTSPISTLGTTCQFIVSTTNIDLNSISLQGSPWLTSSNDLYYFKVKAIDNANNVFSGTAAEFSFKFDSTGPQNPTALFTPQGFQRNISDFVISWPDSGVNTGSDQNSGIKGYQYKINSGPWQGSNHAGTGACSDVITTNTYTLDPSFDTLEIGENTFSLRTLDTTCNISTTSLNAILKFSSNAPSTPTNLNVTPTQNTINAFAFSWSNPTTYSGSQSAIQYCYTVNTTPTENTCTWTHSTSLSSDAYATQPGQNKFYVIAKDEAGNVNYDDYAVIDFTANTSAPSVPRNIDVADISTKATSNWRLAISWDVPEDIGAGIKQYKIFRSTVALANCSAKFSDFAQLATTTGTSYVDPGLQTKDYFYCVRACDSANNCSAVSNTDSGLPTGKFTSPAELISGPTTSGVTQRSVSFTWTTDRVSDTKISITKTSGNYSPLEQGNRTSTKEHGLTINNLSPGTQYFYKASWTDEDGNTGISDEKSFITLPPPSVKDVIVKAVFLNNSLIQFTETGAPKVKVYYSKSTSFESIKEISTSASNGTYTVDLDKLDDGTKYYFKINPVDQDSNEYDGTVLNLTTLPRPRISAVSVQEIKGEAQPTLEVTWQTNTEVSSIVSYNTLDKPAEVKDVISLDLIKGNHKLILKGLETQKDYQIVVRGFDKIGNEARSDSIKITTSSDTRAPKISNLKIESTSNSRINSSGGGAQIIVSWDTDEPATSQVEYGEGASSDFSQKSQEEKTYSTKHVVILSNLSYSKVYHLRAVSHDAANNISSTSDNVVITPRAGVNALDLIITNLAEIFGVFTKIGK